jgi:hypothetical protein
MFLHKAVIGGDRDETVQLEQQLLFNAIGNAV